MSNMTQLTSRGVGRVFCGSIIFFWGLSVSELYLPGVPGTDCFEG
jgi:hypothetical protein